jgi:propanediol dehydratase small subunit
MGVILEGKSANLKGDMEVAKEEAEWYLAEAQEMKDAYDAAIAAGNEEAAELYK